MTHLHPAIAPSFTRDLVLSGSERARGKQPTYEPEHDAAGSHWANAAPSVTDNPADREELVEICACCSGVLDIDEVVGLFSLTDPSQETVRPPGRPQVDRLATRLLAPQTGQPAAPGHRHGGHPAGPGTTASQSVGLALLKAYIAVPGVVFGWQNMVQATRAHATLERLDGFIGQALYRQVQSGARGSVEDAARQNLEAYRDTARHSASMQTFIRYFAGMLSMAQSSLMLAAIWLPSVEPAALALLGIYAGSFVVRYLVYDRPRAAAAARLAPNDRLGAIAREGLAAVRRAAEDRQSLLLYASLFFSLYSLGAFASIGVLSGQLANVRLLAHGALATGTMAVLWLNNVAIKDTFGKNCDALIEREHLGGLPSLYFRIGYVARQQRALANFATSLSATLAEHDGQARRLGHALRYAAYNTASYATFGLLRSQFQRWRTEQRVAELARIGAAGAGPLAALQQTLQQLADDAANERQLAADIDDDIVLALNAARQMDAAQWVHNHAHGHAGEGHLHSHDGDAHAHSHPSEQHAQRLGGHQTDNLHAGHQHAPDEACHDADGFYQAAAQGPDVAALFVARYTRPAHKAYELGALTDHAQARVRLDANLGR